MDYLIPLKRISRDNFTDYGMYFDERGSRPDYFDDFFEWWNEIGIVDIGTSISFGIVKPKFNQEFSERAFEQHEHTPEILIPLDDDIIILVGRQDAFDTPYPCIDDFQAFLVPRGGAVSLNPGVWHHAPMVMNKPARVMVIFKKNTSFEDNTVRELGSFGLVMKVIPQAV